MKHAQTSSMEVLVAKEKPSYFGHNDKERVAWKVDMLGMIECKRREEHPDRVQ